MGEGSEKVMYALGRSPQKREILKAKLLADPTGLSASVYLGQLSGEITKPAKKTTQAPAPAKRATGGNSGGSAEDALKRKYKAESDTQKRFNIRREAKLAGYNVDTW